MTLPVIDPVTGAPNPAQGVNGCITRSVPANAKAVAGGGATVFNPPLQLYVGSAGNITVVPYGNVGDATVTFTAVPAGTILPVLVKQVVAAGLTAGALVGTW